MIERDDPVNWSSLKHMLTSPRHYRHALAHPREDTDALRLGRLLHSMVYEPATVDAKYVVQPRFHAGWNDDTAIKNGWDGGKQALAEWTADNCDKEIVPIAHWERAAGMREALMSDATTRAFIEGGLAEQPIEWTDMLTGIPCRGRVDHINGRLSDLKSTSDLLGFDRQIARYKYHGQLAFYSDGLEANGFEFEFPPVFIAVESSAPYDVAVLTVSPEVLAVGRGMYRRALDMLAECRALDRWPGISRGEIRPVALPAYAMDTEPEVELTLGGEPLY